MVDGGHRLIVSDHGDLGRGHHHFVLVAQHLLAVVHVSADDDAATAVYDPTLFGHCRGTAAVTSPPRAYHLTVLSYVSNNDRRRTGPITGESRAHARLVEK